MASTVRFVTPAFTVADNAVLASVMSAQNVMEVAVAVVTRVSEDGYP